MIGVLTVAPWHNSVGDIATSDATVTHLVDAGIAARAVSSADDGHPSRLVIGGGDLLGGTGRWEVTKRRFEVAGPHVLNAVGVDPANVDRVDWSFASDYRLVTVRDDPTAELLRSRLPRVGSVPCPATIVAPYTWDEFVTFPRQGAIRELVPQGYVVVHRHPRLARYARAIRRQSGMPIAVVDAQAHAQHPWRRGGTVLPATHSPRVMATLVHNAHLVVSVSLHLCVFAIGGSVPFAAFGRGDYQSEKVRRYLDRAGIGDAYCTSGKDLVAVAEQVRSRMRAISDAEQARTMAHLDDVVTAVT